jgi:hypothetical protein
VFTVFLLVVELAVNVADPDVVSVEHNHDISEEAFTVLALDHVVVIGVLVEVFLRVFGVSVRYHCTPRSRDEVSGDGTVEWS